MSPAVPSPYAIYDAIGGGGLIGGIAAYVKSLWPDVQIIIEYTMLPP